ncbi:hypothetical protein FH972_023231 [Carpinus fangiana]|uniref:Nucleolar 27S pre-rRNA processing Urb2/Npa2 C-terminal domain-containing protein n=1 Tax=Carpinus fangiana TaxID=176857 RepID=A0A5N6KWV0_9ROSI|nr:hypothetical protein FH972_023231 [Carpinus fangiana]
MCSSVAIRLTHRQQDASSLTVSSLQKLKTLETDHNDFPTQLQQVAQILGQPRILDDKYVYSQTGLHIAGKADWALRWITKKFGAGDDAGHQARYSTKAWNFVGNLINILPVSSCSQILNTNGFLSCIERAMPRPASGESYTTNSDRNHSSKRRKLDYQDTNASHQTLRSISRCLTILKKRTTTAAAVENSLELEYLRSTLRTDAATAASILRGFFIAQGRGCAMEIGPFLSIWDGRSQSRLDDVTFSETCLPHTGACFASVEDPDEQENKHNKMAIEILIAKHIILPAKATFHTQKAAGTEANESPRTLRALLAPYSKSFRYDPARDDNLSDGNHTGLAPALLDIGIRSTSLDSTRKKALERPWLEHLFTEVASSTGITVETASELGGDETRLVMMTKLLQVAARHRLSLSTSLLGRIALNHQSWTVLALLVQLNPDVFVSSPDTGVPNMLWKKITSSVDIVYHDETPTYDPSYSTVLTDIVVPLMKFFAAARKLPDFLELWRLEISAYVTGYQMTLAELPQVEKAAQAIHRTSVWEDSSLIQALQDVLEASLDSSQILPILQNLHDEAQRNTGKQSYAYQVMIDIILKSIVSTRTVLALQEIIDDIRHVSTRILSSPSNTASAWRLYATCQALTLDIAARPDLLEHDYPMTANYVKETLRRVRSSGAEEIDIHAMNNTTEALMALGSTMKAMRRRNLITSTSSEIAKTNGTAEDHTNQLSIAKELPQEFVSDVTEICHWLREDLKKNPMSGWARKCVLKLSSCPEIYSLDSDSTLRQDVIAGIVNAYGQSSNSGHLEQEIRPAASQLCHEAVQDAAFLNDLMRVLYSKEMGLSNIYGSSNSSRRAHFVETIFLQLPAELVPRSLRERTLDAISDSLTAAGSDLACTVWIRRLSLAVKLLGLPHGGSSASKGLLPIIHAIEPILNTEVQAQLVDDELNPLLCEFTTRILQHHLERDGDGNSKKFLKGFWQKLEHEVTDTSASNRCPVAVMLAMKVAIHLKLSQLFAVKELDPSICERLCTQALQEPAYGSTVDTRWGVAVIDLLSLLDRDVLVKHASKIERIMTTIPSNSNPRSQASLKDLVLEVKSSSKPALNLESAFTKLEGTLSIKDLHHLQQYLLSTAERLYENNPDQLLQIVKSSIHRRGAQSILSILFSSPRIQWSSSSLLSDLLINLCSQLSQTTEIKSFRYLTLMLDAILRLKTKQLSQHSLETILRIITSLTSTSSPQLPSAHASFIHTRLVEIMSTLLTVHRRNFRSRFHLLLPALQGLLQCLFTADSSLSAKARLQQPHWVSTKGGKALGPAHAASLSRLLTLICEPSASAVRTHSSKTDASSRPHLTDETAAARAYAGKYMGYFVLFLCECLLKGRLATPETRDALLQPGIWSVLGVVPKDVLEAQTSARVKGEGRAVLRGLLEEWRRNGGGRGVHG